MLLFLYKDTNTLQLQNIHNFQSQQIHTINTIHVYHLLSILFIYIGWLLPPPIPLGIYILYVGATLLSWRFNADICPMTETEYRLRGWNPAETPGFTQLFLIRPLLVAFGFAPGSRTETLLTDAVVESIYFFFIIAVLRFGIYTFTK
jgi:hypothetical protein